MTIYLVKPKEDKHIRLHQIAHYEFGFGLVSGRSMSTFSAIHNWKQVWNVCDGWHNPQWEKTLKGSLQTGIMQSDGNECHALVEFKDKIYFINGGWG